MLSRHRSPTAKAPSDDRDIAIVHLDLVDSAIAHYRFTDLEILFRRIEKLTFLLKAE